MPQTDLRKMAFAILFMAMGCALAPFTSIPIGIAKINPTQHFINVLAAVLMGPHYATSIAGGVGLIRNALGVGTLFAFPGGMIGALLAGLTFKLTKKETLAAIAEILGSGVLAPLVSSLLVAPYFMGKQTALMALLPAFLLSSLAGSLLARLTLASLKQARVYSV